MNTFKINGFSFINAKMLYMCIWTSEHGRQTQIKQNKIMHFDIYLKLSITLHPYIKNEVLHLPVLLKIQK